MLPKQSLDQSNGQSSCLGDDETSAQGALLLLVVVPVLHITVSAWAWESVPPAFQP